MLENRCVQNKFHGESKACIKRTTKFEKCKNKSQNENKVC
jgi:hypothetical protein